MTDESNIQSGPDPTPPNVRPVSPTSGQTGLSTDARVTAGFDEAMDAATINSSTFELRDASGNLVSTNVTYDAGSKTATLTPNSPLDNSKTYTATLKSGDNGVKDATGNGLTEDMSWSFTTMSISDGQTTPTSTTEVPSRPYNFILALAVILLATIIFGIVMVLFRDTFKDAALVTTALSTLFGIFGTVLGAYFGIKSSNDTSDKARREIAEANDKAGRALAALDPGEGKKITG